MSNHYDERDFLKDSRKCPKCNKRYWDYPAISRRDNKTQICPECGTQEALEDWFDACWGKKGTK